MVDKANPESEKEVQEDLSEVSKELSQEEEKAIPTQPKPTGGRKKLPSQLPVVEKVHQLPEEEQTCECCGEKYEIVFTKESGEKLGVVTQEFYREKNLVTVYCCPCCGIENNKNKVMKTANVAPSIVSKSGVTDDFIATLVYNKISKGLPFYRQEQALKDVNINYSRQNMVNVTQKAAENCTGLYNIIRDELSMRDILKMDETGIQVIKEAGRSSQSKSFMYFAQSPSSSQPFVYCEYSPNRNSAKVKELLADFSGYIQTDSHSTYTYLGKKKDVIHLHCFAHARRNFFKILKKLDENKAKAKIKGSITAASLRFIQALYKKEKRWRKQNLTPEQIYEKRQKESVPLLNSFHKYLMERHKKIPEDSDLYKAVNYCLKHWKGLINYTRDGRLDMDNNSIERQIKHYAVGRKNWLFSVSPTGARTTAIYYTFVLSAKENGLSPLDYLKYVFKKMPTATTLEDHLALLPWNLTPEQISQKAI